MLSAFLASSVPWKLKATVFLTCKANTPTHPFLPQFVVETMEEQPLKTLTALKMEEGNSFGRLLCFEFILRILSVLEVSVVLLLACSVEPVLLALSLCSPPVLCLTLGS